jgi:hypothetical protein
MYIPQEGITIGGLSLFAGDNFSPLSLTHADQIVPILAFYDRYTGVSGLNINVQKSTILCVNCSPELTQELQHKGFISPATIQHLGLEIASDVSATLRETLHKINMKAVKRCILATAPPSDILHRATLINSAMTPLYNHVLMALPAKSVDLQPLYKEMFPSYGQKRQMQKRLIARKLLPASFGIGGLQIQRPADGL